MLWQDTLRPFPLLTADTVAGRVQFRQAGLGPRVTHVLLHGIGSGSASWVQQLQVAAGRADLRLLAWEAPGYGQSAPLAPASPQADDYAHRLWHWLDQMAAHDPVVLVGHSLGAIMAAAAARLQPHRVARLVLLAPARGYGDAEPQLRHEKLTTRLNLLQRLGPGGMAQARASAMLSAQASDDQRALVAHTMAQVHPHGYTQAAHLLGNAVLWRDLQQLRCEVLLASGEADTITPAHDVRALAERLGLHWHSLGPVGHACALEAADAVNALLGCQASNQ
jgi:pimeloyl-ACP methyl ester carboxylesterase